MPWTLSTVWGKKSYDFLPFFVSFHMINLQRNTDERRQMNSITELLDLEDAKISITDISIEGTKKTLTQLIC